MGTPAETNPHDELNETSSGTPVDTGDELGEKHDQSADSESEDDRYLLTQNDTPQAQRISEKKRQDVAIFQTFVTERERWRDSSKDANSSHGENGLSASDKRASDAGSRIIDAPREYQLELFERAKKKNIIVVLDTGSGKTLIAVLLLRHMVEEEMERRAPKQQTQLQPLPNKTAFFLVESVALCVQQHQVLRNNLPVPIGRLHGDCGQGSRREFWETQVKDNMVVVSTAQVLLDRLNNGFLSMKHISLIIFDEAHHTKKKHPYAEIIKSHYIRADTAHRPKILGMTASPVDAQTRDVRAAAAELEGVMFSEIATVPDDILSRTPKAQETYQSYDQLLPQDQTRTALWNRIKRLASNNPFFRAALDFTEEASSTLGPWCADRFWFYLLSDIEVMRLRERTQGEMGNRGLPVETINQAVNAIETISGLVQEHSRLQKTGIPQRLHFSSKFKGLLETLEDQFQKGTSRCIVFVEKRSTALILSKLLQEEQVRIPGVSPAYLVGLHAASSFVAMSFREQVEVLGDFKQGICNCLITTTVAEEGIDIPACDLVIRWDVYNTMIQYIQSRGRARQEGSRFISLIESHNMTHLRRFKQATRDSTALRQFCSALPEDRKVHDAYIVDTAAMARMEAAAQRQLEIEATGARISYQNCLEILARFVSSLHGPSDATFTPEFTVMPVGKNFMAHVILPEVSPISYVAGLPQRAKQLARRSAAYEACVMLHEKKYIDDNLQSTLAKRLPAMRNARLAISSQKKSEYEMRIKPQIWSQAGHVGTLYATVLILDNPSAVSRSAVKRMAILTRKSLPLMMPDVQLYFGTGHTSLVRLKTVRQPVSLGSDQLKFLHGFTLKIFDDIFSKQFNAEASDMPYFLAPVLDSNKNPSSEVINLDWEIIKACQVDAFLAWENQPEDFYRDKLVVDPLDGSRKMITCGINPNLKPSSPTPADAPVPKSRAYRSVERTIREYSNSYFLRMRKACASNWHEEQPVVDAEILPLRRNFLDQYGVDEATNNRCSIILQPLKVSPIPTGVVAMANLLPAIIYRIDQTLIALEACDLLGLKIRPDLALEACTKDSDNSEEHEQQQLNFQHGMGNNYERLEFLGDSFLKMATTISLYTIMPSMKEFESHTARMVLIANQNLFNVAVDRKLQEFIRSKSFDRRLWYPNLPLKRGKAAKTSARHSLGDKTIADVCEALIGAAYLTQEGSMDMAVRAVTKMVKSANHKMKRWSDYYAAYRMPAWIEGGAFTQVHLQAVEAVNDNVGYHFNSPLLLRSAFKHPSHVYDASIPDYQRLEFLGDSLLDMAVVDYLFGTFPLADPHRLTEHKMAIVSNHFLGCLCVKLGLHNQIILTTSVLISQRAEFAADLERAEEAARDDTDGKVRSDYWRNVEQPPKALADVVEALIGAMFVDAKYDYSVVETFFNRHILPYFEDMTLYDSFGEKHPVTWLTRRLATEMGCRDWRLLSQEVPCGTEEGVRAVTGTEVICALLVHGKPFEHATAASGRYAKIACAKKAGKKLEEMIREEYREKTGCRCTVEGDDGGQGGMAVKAVRDAQGLII